MSILTLILMTSHLSLVFPMDLSTEHFPVSQRLLWAVSNDGEMQWRNLGKGEDKITVSAVKLSCFCWRFFPKSFVNQVLTISCYCVPFQSLSLTVDGPGVILDVFCLYSCYIC